MGKAKRALPLNGFELPKRNKNSVAACWLDVGWPLLTDCDGGDGKRMQWTGKSAYPTFADAVEEQERPSYGVYALNPD